MWHKHATRRDFLRAGGIVSLAALTGCLTVGQQKSEIELNLQERLFKCILAPQTLVDRGLMKAKSVQDFHQLDREYFGVKAQYHDLKAAKEKLTDEA